MARLTRSETQAQTRAALLQAARSVLVELGVTAASVDLIAERAGYSKGAVYSNFNSKESILVALLQEHMDNEVAALSAVLAATASLDDLINRVEAFYAQVHAQPGTVILSVEFQLLATRKPEVRKLYATQWHSHRASLSELLQAEADRLQLRLRSPAVEVIDALAALSHGLVLQGAAARLAGEQPVEKHMTAFLRNAFEAASPPPSKRKSSTQR